MRAINLTPHTINIYIPGLDVAIPIEPSGVVARCQEIIEDLDSIYIEKWEVPITRKTFSTTVEGLPEQMYGTHYIVSYLAAQAVPDREDVFFPGEAVRDAGGRIIGCRGLSHV